jgi:hypothetical protein
MLSQGKYPEVQVESSGSINRQNAKLTIILAKWKLNN